MGTPPSLPPGPAAAFPVRTARGAPPPAWRLRGAGAGARGPRGVASPPSLPTGSPGLRAPCPSSEPSSGSAPTPPGPAERRMHGPGRPLLLGLLLVLGAAGPGRGGAEPREAADRQTLLRLIVEIVQELRKYHSGESKRLQLSGRQDYTLDRREVADYAYPEEQRVGESPPARCGGERRLQRPPACGAGRAPGSACLVSGDARRTRTCLEIEL